jgi:hypothetical protein
MVIPSKIVGGMSSGVVLCLSLWGITPVGSDACIDKKAGQSSIEKCGEEKRQGIDTIKGEVLSVEDNNYVVQQFYGKEVRLITDAASRVTGGIDLGDSIEAKVRNVDNQKHVLSIHQLTSLINAMFARQALSLL